MAKVVKLNPKYFTGGGIGYWCPGCKTGHTITTDVPNSQGARWTFDGNAQRPTFSPSVNYRWGTFADPSFEDDPEHPMSGVCHHFVRAGRIEFLGDCTHDLKGQTVDLPDLLDNQFPMCERL